MSAWSLLIEAPAPLRLLAKITVLLMLGWSIVLAFRSRNPRWRVATWRATIAGLGLVAALAALPPLWVWPVAIEAEPAPAPPLAAPLVPAESPDRQWPPPMPVPEAIGAIDRQPVAAQPIEKIRDKPIPRPEIRTPWPASTWLGAVWAVGVGLIVLRWVGASRALSRIVRESTEPPGDVLDARDEVAAWLGLRRVPPIRVSAAIATPCLAGVTRTVLLLPVGHYPPSDLRAILAHELAHQKGRDSIWNGLAHLVPALLWFHPLAWRVRLAHLAACDAVCDAEAANFLGDLAAYTRTLARLALGVAGDLPTSCLAMARGSDVIRRINSLQRRWFRTPLPRRLVMAGRSLAALLALIVGGLALTRAEPPPPASSPPQDSKVEGGMAIKALDDASGGPLEGVEVSYQGQFDGKLHQGKVQTDKNGEALVTWPVALKVGYLKLFTSKAKYVPIYKDWFDTARPIRLPLSQELRYEAGTTIGGIVRDEAGQPVAGAQVWVSAPVAEKENFLQHLGAPTTDAEGRWRLDEAPKVLASVGLEVKHPDFLTGWSQATRNLDDLTTLKRGAAVSGRVLDRDGKPIAGASLILGADRFGTNPPRASADAEGRFTLKNAKPGPSVVTVQAIGFGPDLREVRIDEAGAGPIEFRLGPPSQIRVRVVDRDGHPVAGAYFGADTWREHRSLDFRASTDAEGRIVWNNAPADVVRCDMGATGKMARRQVSLTAGAEATVTLDSELVVAGTVTDARDGRPIPGFQVVVGTRYSWNNRVHWSRPGELAFDAGQYSIRRNEASEALIVKVEADGYKPAQSREIRSSEGSITIDFALEAARGLEGVVLLPDGLPAPGIEVALATEENRAMMSGGGFSRSNGAPTTRTDAAGLFRFPMPTGRYLLLAMGDAGFADTSAAEFSKAASKLALRPWGRVEGRVVIAGKPGANTAITFQPFRPDRGAGIFVFDYDYRATTDAEGRFTLDRVISGPGSVARVVTQEFPGGITTHYPGWSERIDVKSGEVTTVTIGGKGRTVMGRATLGEKPDAPVDWRSCEPVAIQPLKDPSGTLLGAPGRFIALMDRDGQFRIDDVPPGRYELKFDVNAEPEPRSGRPGAKLGQAVRPIEIVAGRDLGPIDLGAIQAELLPTLKVGDVAPDFEARKLDGSGTLKSGDLRGKLVLLSFWSDLGSSAGRTEWPSWGEVARRFEADPRFALVTLAVGPEFDGAAAYLKEHPIAGSHAFAGSWSDGLTSRYRVRTIPMHILVGPEGRIVAKLRKGDDLGRAVADALAGMAR